MKRLKSFLFILLVLFGFLAYSYYNYHKRSVSIDAVEAYRKAYNFKRIWNLREIHLNIFDWLLGDKTQYDYIFINPSMAFYDSNSKYWIQISSWNDPTNIETLKNFTIERLDDTFKIKINDFFWVPTEYYTLLFNQINGTVIERVDNWIKEEGKKELPPINK